MQRTFDVRAVCEQFPALGRTTREEVCSFVEVLERFAESKRAC